MNESNKTDSATTDLGCGVQAHHMGHGRCNFTVDGCVVPHLEGSVDDAEVHIFLDRRIGYTMPLCAAGTAIAAIANAMAIAAGYSSFGRNSRPVNRYGISPSLAFAEDLKLADARPDLDPR